jgi:hypothetical protein
MNSRLLIAGAATLAGLAMLAGIAGQRRELAALRAELPPPPASEMETGGTRRAAAKTPAPADSTPESRSISSPSSALLRLRNQVGLLQRQKQELAGARVENGQLRAQLAAAGTNPPAGKPLPPGYIRTREAQWAGANTPENTIQSFLWALWNHDLTNLAQLLTPESGQKLLARATNSMDDFFAQADVIPGLRIFNLETMDDGSIQAEAEAMPGEPIPGKMRFKLIEGQWRLEFP